MALTTKISELPAKGANLETGDLVPIASVDAASPTGYTTKYVTGSEVLDENALIEFNAQFGTYTLVLSDAGKMVEINDAGPSNLLVPLNSAVAFPIGTQILFSQAGAGEVTVKFTGGTLLSEGTKLTTVGQYALGTLIKKSTDVWYVSGNLKT